MPKALYQCRSSFVTVDSQGVRTRVGIGQLVPEGDWRLKGREQFFTTADDAAGVETADATPGKKRSARRAPTADTSPEETPGS